MLSFYLLTHFNMAKEASANGGSENAELEQAHESMLANPQTAAVISHAVNKFIGCYGATLNSDYAAKHLKKIGEQEYLPVPLIYTIARNQVYRGLLNERHPKDQYSKQTRQSQ